MGSAGAMEGEGAAGINPGRVGFLAALEVLRSHGKLFTPSQANAAAANAAVSAGAAILKNRPLSPKGGADARPGGYEAQDEEQQRRRVEAEARDAAYRALQSAQPTDPTAYVAAGVAESEMRGSGLPGLFSRTRPAPPTDGSRLPANSKEETWRSWWESHWESKHADQPGGR